jgi:hypothetical protein
MSEIGSVASKKTQRKNKAMELLEGPGYIPDSRVGNGDNGEQKRKEWQSSLTDEILNSEQSSNLRANQAVVESFMTF